MMQKKKPVGKKKNVGAVNATIQCDLALGSSKATSIA